MKALLIVNGQKVENSKALELMEKYGIHFLFLPCWKTMVKVPKEIIAEAEALAERLEKMDETFRWKWVYSYLPDVRKQECVLFVIYSPTKDQAYKRGTYFMSKLALPKFERIEKGYYWVEEYPSNLHHKEDNEITIHPEDAEFINKVKGVLLQ
jgi:hypothetical protein